MHTSIVHIIYVPLPVFSPQAIFKDPFRGGNNILVLSIPTESFPILMCFSLVMIFNIMGNGRAQLFFSMVLEF
jgi:hypothetical protein